MSHFDSSASDPNDANPISSGELETPRGGFMARPGMKAPPRHAVVVRQGDAPESEHIPVARSSMPPPPPESLRDRATVRAIPTPRPPEPETLLPPPPIVALAPPPADLLAPTPAPAPPIVAGESGPPPSDAPVVANVEEELEGAVSARGRRRSRAWLTILAAALAGLALGIVSVVTTVQLRESAPSGPEAVVVTSQPAVAAGAPAPEAPADASASGEPRSPEAAPSASSSAASPVAAEVMEIESPPRTPARPAAKRSIF